MALEDYDCGEAARVFRDSSHHKPVHNNLGMNLRADRYPSSGGGGGDGGGSGGGCFIATAAYGSPMATELNILRTWRDESLYTSRIGKLFCEAYYRVSPPLAKLIEKSERSRAAVRRMLNPVIKI